MTWTDTDKGNLFRYQRNIVELLEALVKQGEDILLLAKEVERLKEAVRKLESER